MDPGLTANGMSDHGEPDRDAIIAKANAIPMADLDLIALDHDTGILHTLHVICGECENVRGPLMQGRWFFDGGHVYCPQCHSAEAHE